MALLFTIAWLYVLGFIVDGWRERNEIWKDSQRLGRALLVLRLSWGGRRMTCHCVLVGFDKCMGDYRCEEEEEWSLNVYFVRLTALTMVNWHCAQDAGMYSELSGLSLSLIGHDAVHHLDHHLESIDSWIRLYDALASWEPCELQCGPVTSNSSPVCVGVFSSASQVVCQMSSDIWTPFASSWVHCRWMEGEEWDLEG